MTPRPERIETLDDARVAPFRALRERELRTHDEPAARGWFIAEGKLVFERLLTSPHRVRSVFVDEARVEELAPQLAKLPIDTPVYTAPVELHASISGAKFHQGLLALGERAREPALDDLLERATRIVVLEGIVNHDNVGAVFRNVAALAGERGAVLLDPTCADPLYRKAIRVSMGWVLHVPFARLAPWPSALQRVKERGFRALALTPGPGSIDIDVAARMRYPRVALLVGAEEPGLTPAALAAADARVRVPISAHVDSLNLAATSAIALHRFAPEAPSPS